MNRQKLADDLTDQFIEYQWLEAHKRTGPVENSHFQGACMPNNRAEHTIAVRLLTLHCCQ